MGKRKKGVLGINLGINSSTRLDLLMRTTI